MITAVIGDVASHLGCFIFLKDTVNAIAFVALGTSVPGNCETVFSRDWPTTQNSRITLYVFDSCTLYYCVHSFLDLCSFAFSLLYTGLFNGYVTFVTSILMIGFVTAIIGDVAGHLGCFIFLKDSVNAIAFVALGTSVPGTILSSTQN